MRLAAVIPCRNGSTRLYAKPLQSVGGRTVLEHLVGAVRKIARVEAIVLAISEGRDNDVYEELADRWGLGWVRGNERDVLKRLIIGARSVDATHLLRVTPDQPFIYWEGGTEIAQWVEERDLDYAVHRDLPDGAFYEIVSLSALEKAHREGEDRHRSEFSTSYLRENPARFRMEEVPVPHELARPEIQLNVDWPQDLIVIRAIYQALSARHADPLPLREIVKWLDENPRMAALNREPRTAGRT